MQRGVFGVLAERRQLAGQVLTLISACSACRTPVQTTGYSWI